MKKESNISFQARLRKGHKWFWAAAGAVLLVNWLGLAAVIVRLPGSLQEAPEKYKKLNEQAANSNSAQKDVVKKLHEKNLFAPKPPKPQPPRCVGILGDAAFFNDKWYKVGEEVGGAKIIALNSKAVTILWEGREMELVPFITDDKGSGPNPPRPPSGPERSEQGRPGPPPEGKGPGFFMKSGGGFFNMSPEERAEMRRRYEAMTPEQREQLRQQMQERFQKGGGGFRGRD